MRADDCIPKAGGNMLTLDQARKIVESFCAPVAGFEQVVLKNALGRVLFEATAAPISIPQETQSSMDGYALNGLELLPNRVSQFRVAGTSWAGHPFMDPPGEGECVRIFTGAFLPPGTDSVVIQENVQRKGEVIEVPPGIAGRQNIRAPGDEIQRGQVVLEQGKRLAPADLGILAALGIHEIRVRRMPRVAFFSTGDELVSFDTPPERGQIYDSNRSTLNGMLKVLGIDAMDFGVIRDDRDAILDTLKEASAVSDMIISSGGVSVGEADLVKNAFESLGHVEFWKIAMKPGKPLAFGPIGTALFFGLPGNPVSVFVTFYQIVRPALLGMMGADPGKPVRIRALCTAKILKAPGRQEFQRGKLFFDESGAARVAPAEKQQAHQLSAMAKSNCFIVLPAACEGLAKDEPVEVELIDPAFHLN